jgi:hypothetical protein
MGGVEPPTSSLPRMRSNHLSYMGTLRRNPDQAVERETGLEPATPSLEGLCSSQLSYSRPKLFRVCLRCAIDLLGGEGRIRTSEGVSQRVYSPSQLTALVPLRR